MNSYLLLAIVVGGSPGGALDAGTSVLQVLADAGYDQVTVLNTIPAPPEVMDKGLVKAIRDHYFDKHGSWSDADDAEVWLLWKEHRSIEAVTIRLYENDLGPIDMLKVGQIQTLYTREYGHPSTLPSHVIWDCWALCHHSRLRSYDVVTEMRNRESAQS